MVLLLYYVIHTSYHHFTIATRIFSTVASEAGTSGSRNTFSTLPCRFIKALIPAGFPSTKSKRYKGVRVASISCALSTSPTEARCTICANSFANPFPITEITPSAPDLINGSVIPSSPENTLNPAGRRDIISFICSIFPDASFIPIILLQSAASRKVVSGSIFTPVRPGTLYKTMGSSVASAIALKCAYIPCCEGLL